MNGTDNIFEKYFIVDNYGQVHLPLKSNTQSRLTIELGISFRLSARDLTTSATIESSIGKALKPNARTVDMTPTDAVKNFGRTKNLVLESYKLLEWMEVHPEPANLPTRVTMRLIISLLFYSTNTVNLDPRFYTFDYLFESARDFYSYFGSRAFKEGLLPIDLISLKPLSWLRLNLVEVEIAKKEIEFIELLEEQVSSPESWFISLLRETRTLKYLLRLYPQFYESLPSDVVVKEFL